MKNAIPEEHRMVCDECGTHVDMRDLDQVFAHEHEDLRVATDIQGDRIECKKS